MKALLRLVLLAALAAASAAHAECFELNGIEYCGPPKPKTTWTIGICHEAGSFGPQDVAWCQAIGGTWNNGCQGGDPVVPRTTRCALG